MKSLRFDSKSNQEILHELAELFDDIDSDYDIEPSIIKDILEFIVEERERMLEILE